MCCKRHFIKRGNNNWFIIWHIDGAEIRLKIVKQSDPWISFYTEKEDIIQEITFTDIAAYNLQPFLIYKAILKNIENVLTTASGALFVEIEKSLQKPIKM